LAQVEGLTKELLYYLEHCGYIIPTKRPTARISRNQYSARDVELLRRIVFFYRKDYPPRVAYQKAIENQTAGRRLVRK